MASPNKEKNPASQTINSVPHTSSTSSTTNEISSISIPPRSCFRVTSAAFNGPSTPDEVKSERKTIRLNRGMSQDMDREVDRHVMMVKSPSVVSLPADMSHLVVTSRHHPGEAAQNFVQTEEARQGIILNEPKQSSITINFYRRPSLNPFVISNSNTAITSGTGPLAMSHCDNHHQDSPKMLNGSACLSLVKATVQAQECSSDDLRVTVPPIRSELVLNVSNSHTPTTDRIPAAVCPRPAPGPLQPGPELLQPGQGPAQPGLEQIQPQPGLELTQPGQGLTQPKPELIKLCKGPLQPGTELIQPGKGLSQPCQGLLQSGQGPPRPSPELIQPGRGPLQPDPVPAHEPQQEHLQKQGPELAKPESELENKQGDEAENGNEAKAPAESTNRPNVDGEHKDKLEVKEEKENPDKEKGTTDNGSNMEKSLKPEKPNPPVLGSIAQSEGLVRPDSNEGVSTTRHRVAHFNLPRVRPYRSLFAPPSSTNQLGTPLASAILSQPALTVLNRDRPANLATSGAGPNSMVYSVQGPNINPQGAATNINNFPLTMMGGGIQFLPNNCDGAMGNPPPYGPRSQFPATMSPGPPAGTSPSSAGTPVSNLPPRPPSLKKPNLGPLQASPSTSSLGSPSTSSPMSHVSPSRRGLGGASGSSSTPGSGQSTPITSPGRGLSLQTNLLFQNRRQSMGSQDSVPGCSTPPTKSNPPNNLPLGRFPCIQSPGSQAGSGIPPFYQPPGASPATSPYHDSPSNSRPPSWYSYRMFRGRDSSPSATSRDSLDSFIRSPPSGIFCTRNSVDNLIASRSVSMDNISDTSGDSVFDDIMSEKKSLNDTCESGGSLGSLTIPEYPVVSASLDGSAGCLDTLTPVDGAAAGGACAGSQQYKHPVPGSAWGISKRDSMNMSTAGETTASSNPQSDVEGPSTPTTPPTGQSGQSPLIMQTSQGQITPSNNASLTSMGPESPPSYEEAIGLVPEGASSSHLLTYKDFVPTYNAQRRVWEPFNKVVLQANEWLVLNPEVRISSSESVLGFAAQTHGFNPDRAIGTRSQVAHENTYNLRFLRIWYSRLDQTHSDLEPQQIRYANFVSPAENASITTLVDLINSKLNSVIKGDILNVETIYILRKAIQCPDTPCWIERPHDPKAYSFFLRMFWLEPQETRQETIKLGYMDFVPQHASGKNYPNDYEPFSVLVQVAQWWASHKAEPGANIINCQSLYVKRKPLSTYWQRLHYTESAGGNNFLKNTYYNQILRFYFQTPTSSLGIPVSPTLHISCRTFTPVQLTSPTDPCLKFESFGETVNRVLHWLRLSGAQLMSIETIKIRMYGGLQGPHGAESTLMRSEGRRYADQEHWIHCIRVYLVGQYQEPDSARIPPIPHVVPYFTTSPRPVALLPPIMAFL